MQLQIIVLFKSLCQTKSLMPSCINLPQHLYTGVRKVHNYIAGFVNVALL